MKKLLSAFAIRFSSNKDNIFFYDNFADKVDLNKFRFSNNIFLWSYLEFAIIFQSSISVLIMLLLFQKAPVILNRFFQFEWSGLLGLLCLHLSDFEMPFAIHGSALLLDFIFNLVFGKESS